MEIVKDFENNKSSDIPIRVIKKSVHVYSESLSQYFNILMRAGKFPDTLKLGKVTPVFKKGNDIYISRLSNLGTYVLFADDTNIFVEGATAQEAYEKGNKLLKCLQNYMILNKLHVNMSKCCFMHFKPSKCATSEKICDSDLKLEIDGFAIKQCNQTRFLGVIIDEKLNWDAHIK